MFFVETFYESLSTHQIFTIISRLILCCLFKRQSLLMVNAMYYGHQGTRQGRNSKKGLEIVENRTWKTEYHANNAEKGYGHLKGALCT